jgi:putative transposase
LIKTEFTKRCDPVLRDGLAHQGNNGAAGIWQQRYWEHLIRDDTGLRRHIEYIRYNPVKHGLVRRPADWPHTSFHRYVDSGVYPLEWGSSEIELSEGVGRE